MKNKSQTPYKLGIDIGTGSVAWAAMGLDENNQPTKLIASGTTIFNEPTYRGEGGYKLKNEDRRRARLMRRQTERKRERITKIMHLANALEVTPEKLTNALLARKETQSLWHLRVQALDQRVSLEEFFLIVLRLAKNRGYNGDAPKANKKGDLGKVAQGLAITQQLVAESPVKVRTVAEAIWLSQANLPLNQKKFRKRIETGTYVLRKDIQHEFDEILKEQCKHHPILNNALETIYPARNSVGSVNDNIGTRYFWGHAPASIGLAIRVAVFYQKPLQAFKDKIGICSLDKSSLRVVAAHPAHQAFRIEKLLADLRWGGAKSTEVLTQEQKNFLRTKLESTAEPSFSAIYKDLEKTGHMHPDGLILNFHTPRRDYLRGNTTRARLRSLKLLEAFEKLNPREQSDVFLALADDVNAPEMWRHDGARDYVVKEYGHSVAEFIDQIADSKDGLDRLRAMDFDAGRVSYGVPALEALTKTMRERQIHGQHVDEHAAINLLYPSHHQKLKVSGNLAEVHTLDLRSPVVEHALLYTRRELLSAVKRLGPPQAMVIELAKEVKSTLEKRNLTTSRQNFEERENEKARKEIREANCRITNTSILRYKLWKQQAKRCPYSGNLILSIKEALNGALYEIEHIVPQRLQGVGNRFEEVVLASKQFNGIKAGHETPYLASQRAGNAVWNWDVTEQALKFIEKESKFFRIKAKLIRDKTEFRVDSLDDDAFVDRQLQETQWIGRVVQSWCSQLCNDVTVIRGGLTAELRREWGFHTVLEEVRTAEGRHESEKAKTLFYKPNRIGEMVFDKRSDHRHHLIDACVIALSTRQNYTDAVKARNARAAGRRSSYTPPGCPIPSLRQHLVKMLNGYCVWHVPDHKVAGLMFDQMPFSLGKDGLSLMKDGEKSRTKFNPKFDNLISHTDRHGRKHQKAVLKNEFACFRITKEGIFPLTIAQYVASYSHGSESRTPTDERLIFKGDLLIFKNDPNIFRVAYFKERDGVCAVHAVETRTFDELATTRLNQSFKKTIALLDAKIIRHPIELAVHAKLIKATNAN
jgi:CRISPR-associated endonuclease Csn1